MRARKNQTTVRILAELEKGSGTALEIAERLQEGTTKISTILLRLYQQGHVGRERIRQGVIVIDKDEGVVRPRHLFQYSINEKGKSRHERIAAKTGS